MLSSDMTANLRLDILPDERLRREVGYEVVSPYFFISPLWLFISAWKELTLFTSESHKFAVSKFVFNITFLDRFEMQRVVRKTQILLTVLAAGDFFPLKISRW